MSDAATSHRDSGSVFPVAAAWVVALVAVAAVGGLATDTDSAWYRALDLPAFQPPGAAFGIVWTILYAMIAVSATLATRDVPTSLRTKLVALFAANLVLNVAWTWIFFQGERPTLAGIEILFLLATTLVLVKLIRPHNALASNLLVPYALWVTFATVLTWTIALTN